MYTRPKFVLGFLGLAPQELSLIILAFPLFDSLKAGCTIAADALVSAGCFLTSPPTAAEALVAPIGLTEELAAAPLDAFGLDAEGYLRAAILVPLTALCLDPLAAADYLLRTASLAAAASLVFLPTALLLLGD